jgi:hypothetical protein
MRQYIAKFSTGEVTRNSNHDYKTAAAWINQTTGQIKNVCFSKGIAKASRMGCCVVIGDDSRKYYASKEAFLKAQAKAEENAKNWKMEIVTVLDGEK